jgi:TRAP-type C4-dicarboxylate transport system permease small subunit
VAASIDNRALPDVLPDSDLPASETPPPATPMNRIAFLIGAAGLLTATATDAIAVLGRHTGVTLLGSIEIVQCAVIMAASAAMIGATLQRAHASVHIFTERMSPSVAAWWARVAAFLGAALFLAAAIGSIWVASDLWNGFEKSELLGIPLRGFRIIWIGAALLVMGLFARDAFGKAHS